MAKDVLLVSTWTANFMKKKKKKPEQPIRAHRKGSGYKKTQQKKWELIGRHIINLLKESSTYRIVGQE